MEACREAVVSGGDPAEVLEPAEHPLDGVTAVVKLWRETVFPDAIGFRWDVRGRPLGLDLSVRGVAISTNHTLMA